MCRAAGRLFRLHRSSVGYNSHIKVQWGILLFFPQYNNIIPQQQELVKEYYRKLSQIIGSRLELVRFLQILRHWNSVSLTLRPQIAYSHWLKMRPQRVNATGFCGN